MLRKSFALLALLLSFLTTEVFALGLGRVSVESSLNQPLRVRIEVLQLGDTRLDEVNIQLASPEDFQRFNIERASFLNNIRFATQASAEGNFVILTTNQVVREPYLSFILETRWSNGRLLSEHTILLDLPVYEEQPVPEAVVRRPISAVLEPQSTSRSEPAVSAPATDVPSVQPIIQPEIIAPASAETDSQAGDQEQSAEPLETAALTQNEPQEQDTENAEQQPIIEAEEASSPLEDDTETSDGASETRVDDELEVAEDIAAEDAVDESDIGAAAADIGPETIVTEPSDTLSDIALRVRPDDSVSIQQTMLAIQALNPDAFTDGNINRMRRGEVLRVPSLADIQAIDQREAVAEVSRQNQEMNRVDVQPLAAPPSVAPEQDEEAGGQLSVITGDPDADAAVSGAGVAENAEDSVLDQRIAELENQLALREEEADRARIEREELESRLAELDEQIAAAQEIIRLRDLQLAQLQQSLADAAAEAEAQQQAAAEPAPVLTPSAVEQQSQQPAGLLDTIVQAVIGNSIILIGAVVAIILLLVGLLVLRSRASQPDEEDLDSIDENEFKGVTDFKEEEEGIDDGDVGLEAELHDYQKGDLDSELDDIISVGGQADKAASADSVLDNDEDIASQADVLIEHGQLEQAERLVNDALAQDPLDTQLQLKRLEITAAKGDLSAFEMYAENLQQGADPETDEKIAGLRDTLSTNALAEQTSQAADGNEDTQRQNAETASFLDDLGIDLDAFEDDAFQLTDEPVEKASSSTESSDGQSGESEPEPVDLMFDLAADSEPAKGDEEDDEGAGKDIELDLDTDDSIETEEQDIESDSVDDIEAFDLSEASDSDVPSGDSKEPADVEIDTLEFDVEAELDTESKASEPEEKLDLETFSFEAPEFEPEPEDDSADGAGPEEDENVLDFDFDKSELESDTAPEPVADVETFDFDLEGDSADTIVEKSDSSTDEVSSGLDNEPSETDVGSSTSSDLSTASDDFDFDLSELEINEDEAPVEDVEIELTDDDFLDLDEEVEALVSADSTAADDVEFELDEEPGVTDESSDTVIETDSDDDLDFLADDDIAFDVPDIEGDPESLSDEDETATKLELAYAYQKMGDADGAREILQEVIAEGTDAQVKEARDLVEMLDSSSE